MSDSVTNTVVSVYTNFKSAYGWVDSAVDGYQWTFAYGVGQAEYGTASSIVEAIAEIRKTAENLGFRVTGHNTKK